MTEYMTEQEQIQQLKNWFKQYGFTIIAGIAIAVIATSGWNGWQNYKEKKLAHASAVYDEMLSLRAQNKTAETVIQAKKIIKHYSNTPYAQMAAFMLARDAVNNANYTEAKQQLAWVSKHSKNASIRGIAQLRVARILIMEKKSQEALATLEKLEDNNFIGLINEIRGDAYLALDNPASARKAYQAALKEVPHAEVMRPLLQMKLDNLTI